MDALVIIILMLLILQPVFGLYFHSVVLKSTSFFDVVMDSLKNRNSLKFLLIFRAIYIYYFFILEEKWIYSTMYFSLFLTIFAIGLKFNLVVTLFFQSALAFSFPVMIIFSLLVFLNGIFRLFVNWSLILNVKLYYHNRIDVLDALDNMLLKAKFAPLVFVGRYVANQTATHITPGSRPPMSTWGKTGIVAGCFAAVGTCSAAYVGYESLKTSKATLIELQKGTQATNAATQAQITANQIQERKLDLEEVKLGLKPKSWYDSKHPITAGEKSSLDSNSPAVIINSKE